MYITDEFSALDHLLFHYVSSCPKPAFYEEGISMNQVIISVRLASFVSVAMGCKDEMYSRNQIFNRSNEFFVGVKFIFPVPYFKKTLYCFTLGTVPLKKPQMGSYNVMVCSILKLCIYLHLITMY